VVTKTFHGAGLVVPVDKNDVGYRELPETNGKYLVYCILPLSLGSLQSNLVCKKQSYFLPEVEEQLGVKGRSFDHCNVTYFFLINLIRISKTYYI